jgi:hypothetical protein
VTCGEIGWPQAAEYIALIFALAFVAVVALSIYAKGRT